MLHSSWLFVGKLDTKITEGWNWMFTTSLDEILPNMWLMDVTEDFEGLCILQAISLDKEQHSCFYTRDFCKQVKK